MHLNTTSPEWWQQADSRSEVEACLDNVNGNLLIYDIVHAFSGLMEGLNRLWNQRARSCGQRNLSDSEAFRQLLVAIPEPRQSELCNSVAVRNLATFTPQILNHKTLNQSPRYNPGQPLHPTLERQASKEHRLLREALDEWSKAPNEATRTTVLKKLAALIYVVKSNIAHGNKTRFGPDFAKAERDRQVCMAGIPALHEILNSIFDHPWQKLIAYGTLRPNEPNHEVLAPIRNQTWEDCEITGSLTDTDGLKEFKWHVSTERHVAKLLSSPELPSHWQMLDDFEGDGYVRTFATALVNGTLRVAMVYQKR